MIAMLADMIIITTMAAGCFLLMRIDPSLATMWLVSTAVWSWRSSSTKE